MGSKVFTIILIVVFILLAGGVSFFAVSGYKEGSVELVKVEDIYIPENVDEEKLFGLFFYNADGTFNRTTEAKENINFDPNKPTVIFFHGVQIGLGYHDNELMTNAKGWVAEGYNVASYFWSQMSDFFPNVCVKSVWSREYIPFKYEKDGVAVEENKDMLNYSLAECFVAYYVDFLSQYDYKGSFINLQGLSLGGNMLSAVNSYLLALERNGKIGKELLPDRVTYFDTYMSSSYSDTFVPWLNSVIGENGTTKMAYLVAKELRSRGIAVEYVASSMVSNLGEFNSSGDKDMFKRFTDETVLLNFDCAFTGALNQPAKHIAGKNWYHRIVSVGHFYDYTAENPEGISAYAPSPAMPISYAYARMGAIYGMEKNQTELDFDDDKMLSENITSAKIAGFAFRDKNNNGINDDRLYNRIDGVTVELYEQSGTLLQSTQTKNGGYYEFSLSDSQLGKSYYVQIKAKDGFTVGKYDTGAMLMMGNGINTNLKSNTFTLTDILEIKIINIGLI